MTADEERNSKQVLWSKRKDVIHRLENLFPRSGEVQALGGRDRIELEKKFSALVGVAIGYVNQQNKYPDKELESTGLEAKVQALKAFVSGRSLPPGINAYAEAIKNFALSEDWDTIKSKKVRKLASQFLSAASGHVRGVTEGRERDYRGR